MTMATVDCILCEAPYVCQYYFYHDYSIISNPETRKGKWLRINYRGWNMNPQSILVVDDDEMVLDVVARSLQKEGLHVLTARSGEDGLQLLRTRDVALVISDQKMAGLSGLEFLHQVKIAYPDILTIMMTGYADVETAMEAINTAGVYKFIVKPLNIQDLRVTIRRALELRRIVMERDMLLDTIKGHEARLRELEKKNPGISRVERDENGNVVLDLNDS